MTRYQRTHETIFALVDKDVVALHVGQGKCFGMEKVSADIWDMLAEPVSIEELCRQLQDRYAVRAVQCRTEVEQVIGQMVDEGLVRAAA